MKLSEADAAKVLDHMLARLSAHTTRAYRGDLEHFRAWVRKKTVPAALYYLLGKGQAGARLMVERYDADCVGSAAKNTRMRRLAAIKSFVSKARRYELVSWRLEVEMAQPKTREAKKATAQRNMSGPSPEQFKAIMAAVERELNPDDPEKRMRAMRDRVVLALLENPMLRRAELAALSIEDLNLNQGRETVTIIGKGRDEPEALPLPPGVVKVIREWLAFRDGRRHDPLLVRYRRDQLTGELRLTNERLSVSGIYDIAVSRGKAGLGRGSKRVNPHALRHTGVTKLANYADAHGIPVTDAMRVSRHKKAETFERYRDRHRSRSRELVNAIEG